MYRKNISVIIPAYNEEKNLEKMVSLILKNFQKEILELIVVNDNSTDKTESILNKLTEKNSKIKAIHRKGKNGVGLAIRDGLRHISLRSDYILLLDCDFTENIKNIKNVVNSLGPYDGVLGSRYLVKKSLINYPLIKKIANRGFHFFIKFLLNIHFKDVTNNFKFYKREVIDRIYPFLKSSGFSINAETGIYPILMRYKLKEVPVFWIGRTAEMGISHFKVIQAGGGYVKVLLYSLRLKFSQNKP